MSSSAALLIFNKQSLLERRHTNPNTSASSVSFEASTLQCQPYAAAMVVLVDLSDSISDPHVDPVSSFSRPFQKPVHSLLAELQLASAEVVRDDGRPNLNLNGFSAALSCYP